MGSDDVQDILNILVQGDRVISYSSSPETILVLGERGTGKTTLSHFLASKDDNMVSVANGSGNYTIRDDTKDVTFCSSAIDSCTVIPKLIIDKTAINTVYYDFPGFSDIRSVAHDIGVSYFNQKVVRRVNSAKIIFTMSYDSVRKGGDKQAFMDLAKNIDKMFTDIRMFEKSVSLVVTNVDNVVEKTGNSDSLVPDDVIIQNIVEFLQEAKNDLSEKIKTSLPPEEEKLYGSTLSLINILINGKETSVPKIGIFRRPNEEGPLSKMKLLQRGKTVLQKLIYQQLAYTLCEPQDFGYTISDSSKMNLNALKDGINDNAKQEVAKLGQHLVEYYHHQESKSEAIDDLIDTINVANHLMSNLASVNDRGAQDFIDEITAAINKLKADVPSDGLQKIQEFSGYLGFVESVMSHSASEPLRWGHGLKDLVDYLTRTEAWYRLLIQLRATLEEYPIQQKVGHYDDIRKKLVSDIDTRNREGVLANLKQFLSKINEDSGTKYEIPPNETLQENKLKFLRDLVQGFAPINSECTGNKLVVKGNVIKMGDVVTLPCFRQSQFVELFGLSKVFFDVDIEKKEGLLRIFSPELVVVNERKLVLDGKDNSDYVPDRQDELGKPGVPGKPGGSAGGFTGIGQVCTNCNNLSISALGGKGGRGQDGGSGIPGRDGEQAEYHCDPQHWQPQCGNPSYRSKFTWEQKMWHCYTEGQLGEKGGNGGDGGRGGEGGLAGQASLVFSRITKGPAIKISSGPVGEGGTGGRGGQGGRQGDTLIHEPYIWRDVFHGWQYNCGSSHHELSNYVAPDGDGGKDNYYSQSLIQPNTMNFDPSSSISEYKNFLRENMGNSMNNAALKKFLEYLEEDSRVNSFYNTKDLLDDMTIMESQIYSQSMSSENVLHYKNFLRRITKYAQDLHTKGMADEDRLVLGYLYTSILSKICRIQESSRAELVIDIKGYLKWVKEDIKQLEDFKNTMEKNKSKTQYQKTISDKIDEAKTLINEEILPEIDGDIQQLRENMQSLLDETIALENEAQANEIKLNDYRNKLKSQMVRSTIFGIVQGIGQAVGFLGPVGALVGSAIGLASTVAEDITNADSGSSEGPDPISNLPDGVSKCLDVFKDLFKKKQGKYQSQLSEAEKTLNELTDVSMIAALKEKIQQTQRELKQTTEEAASGNRAAIGKSYQIKQDFNKSMKETLEELAKQKEIEKTETAKIEKCIKVVSNIQNVVKMTDIGLDIYEKVTKEKSSIRTVEEALEQNEQHIAKLKEYEKAVYSTLLPMAEAINDQVQDAVKSSSGKSRAALDVSNWKVQSAIRNVKSQLKDMTAGFKMQGKILNTIDNVIYGMTTMSQVYDNIQDYYDRAQLADYISDITSNRADSIRIHVSDNTLQSAIDQMAFKMHNNFVLSEYEKSMSAVRQYVFPFGQSTEEYNLPIEFQVGNASHTIAEVINNIGIVFERLQKYVTVILADDENIFPKQIFNSQDDLNPPFYVWNYSNIKEQARQLFQGYEVMLNADVSSGIQENAIKFDRVGVYFKAKCSPIQTELNEALAGFSIKLTHLGNSYYKCGQRTFRMTHGDIGIQHSVNKRNGEYYNQNEVYEKITSNDPLLSPYGMWKLQLIGDYSKLETFIGHAIDIELEGRGSYMNHKEDEYVCTDDLKKYYEEVTDSTIYIEKDTTGIVNPGDVEECENENTLPSPKPEINSILEFMNPITTIANMLNLGKTVDTSNNTINISFPSNFEKIAHHQMAGENSHNSSFIQTANYHLLDVNGSLLLMDTLIRSVNGNSPQRIKVKPKDEEYAHRLAYSAYAP